MADAAGWRSELSFCSRPNYGLVYILNSFFLPIYPCNDFVYSSNAEIPFFVILQVVHGIFPLNDLFTPIYPAMRSFSICTLKLPDVAPVCFLRYTKSASSTESSIDITANRNCECNKGSRSSNIAFLGLIVHNMSRNGETKEHTRGKNNKLRL